MKRISIKTDERIVLVDITGKVQEAVAESKTKSGVCFIFCPHTTAGLTINENADPSVQEDIIRTMKGLVPENAGYAHSEGNADSHVKASLFGPSLTVFVEAGKLSLGRWQGIYFCEGDGPRSREVWLKMV